MEANQKIRLFKQTKSDTSAKTASTYVMQNVTQNWFYKAAVISLFAIFA